MRKFIKMSSANAVIFEDEYFEFRRNQGIGMNNTPWEGLNVVSKDLAKEYVVDVRLRSSNNPKFDGSPVKYEYSDAYVAYGFGSRIQTLEETETFITIMQDAVDFARRVNEWLYRYNTGEIEGATNVTGHVNEFFRKRSEAYNIFKKYTLEQINYVNACHDEIAKEISEMYQEDLDPDQISEIRSINIGAIKTDYLIGAIEDDLMTEEEFDEIFDALEITRTEDAMAYA